jgi:hypothetical protein
MEHLVRCQLGKGGQHDIGWARRLAQVFVCSRHAAAKELLFRCPESARAIRSMALAVPQARHVGRILPLYAGRGDARVTTAQPGDLLQPLAVQAASGRQIAIHPASASAGMGRAMA